MSLAESFHSLFEGNKDAYGEYYISGEVQPDGKRKGSAKTLTQPLTLDNWKNHLSGNTQLGIIPINNNNLTKFGAIDIDDYNLDHKAIQQKINEEKLPLMMCKSKSGGAHLYLFVTGLTPALNVQNKLKEIASHLGYASAEIFPKQTKILVERGDIGNWINMPYFGGDKGNRKALNHNMSELSSRDFLIRAGKLAVTPEELLDLKLSTESIFKDGPPCLETIDVQGPNSPNKGNTFLFNVGVYFIHKHPDNWRDHLERYNAKLAEPISATNMLTLIKSLSGKDYFYTCSKEPVCSFCFKRLCKRRKFGIKGEEEIPEFGSLTKLATEPPIWFLSMNDERLELSTDELQKPLLFQKRCMDALNIMPQVPSKEVWTKAISLVMTDVTVIEVPKQMTLTGQFENLVYDYLITRPRDNDKDYLLRGLVFEENNLLMFRLEDFIAYVDRRNFKHFKPNKIVATLLDLGFIKGTVTINDREFRVFAVSGDRYKKVKYTPQQFNKDDKTPY